MLHPQKRWIVQKSVISDKLFVYMLYLFTFVALYVDIFMKAETVS